MDIYNTVQQKAENNTMLAPDVGDSVELWLEKLRAMGRRTLFEATPGKEARGGYTIALYSPWQQKLIPEYGDIVCLDSTHNTCHWKNDEKVFLSTVLTRDCVTGRGVPLAFMLTNLESHCPLKHFLKWLRRETGICPNTFMIDCSDTEALAINESFPGIVVLYCYWYLWQAWDRNITNKASFKSDPIRNS